MLTLLLVDDEPMARSHIRSIYPWREWGFDIIGEAANGSEALAFCSELVPDIALVDITMPLMDGLTLLEQLKLRYPDMQVIILTAHRDFGYAQKAIQKGASGYILKSSGNTDETKEALDRARHEINKQRATGENLKFRQQVMQNYEYPIRKQFFADIVSGLVSEQDEIIRKASSIGLHIHAERYILLVCIADKPGSVSARYSENNYNPAGLGLLDIVRDLLNQSCPVKYEIFPTEAGHCAILLLASGSAALAEWQEEHAFPMLNAINDAVISKKSAAVSLEDTTVSSEEQPMVSMVVSEPFTLIRQLKDKYHALLSYTGHRYYQKKPQPIILSQAAAFHRQLTSDYETLYESFQTVIQDQDRVRLDKWLAQAELVSLHYKPHPEQLRQWLHTLAQAVELHSGDEPVTDWPVFKQSASLFESTEQLRKWLIAWWDKQNKMVKTRPEIARSIQYIKKHLDADLSLELVAEKVELSSAYLSRIFKKDMGISMTDYITEQRIQLAKKYLTDGTYRNFELAEKIGFKSYSYFCTIFKKVTGQTPNEYKNSRVSIHSES
ncbi:response regulator transcription factor [Paenibacillus thalictri]|uniref:Response regulator n=1 Tax=Paenibacillus thalictri TaxID=2527873 RepID=A0A4Q9DG18_9BACL|nr:response regulator [Paenibacillus thalictri]TBL71105.1 response regulator [Paenibacillus thalictri]